MIRYFAKTVERRDHFAVFIGRFFFFHVARIASFYWKKKKKKKKKRLIISFRLEITPENTAQKLYTFKYRVSSIAPAYFPTLL